MCSLVFSLFFLGVSSLGVGSAVGMEDLNSNDLKIKSAELSLKNRYFFGKNLDAKAVINSLQDPTFEKFIKAIDINNPDNPLSILGGSIDCTPLEIPLEKDGTAYTTHGYRFTSSNKESNGKVIFYVIGDNNFLINPLKAPEEFSKIQSQVKDLKLELFGREESIWYLPTFHYLTQQGFSVIALNRPTNDLDGSTVLLHEGEEEPKNLMASHMNYGEEPQVIGKVEKGEKAPYMSIKYTGTRKGLKNAYKDVIDCVKDQIKEITDNPSKYGLKEDLQYIYWGFSGGSFIGGCLLDDPEIRNRFEAFNLCSAFQLDDELLQSLGQACEKGPKVNIIQGLYDHLFPSMEGIFALAKYNLNPDKITVTFLSSPHSFLPSAVYGFLARNLPGDHPQSESLAKERTMKIYQDFLNLIEGETPQQNYLKDYKKMFASLLALVPEQKQKKELLQLLSFEEKEVFFETFFKVNDYDDFSKSEFSLFSLHSQIQKSDQLQEFLEKKKYTDFLDLVLADFSLGPILYRLYTPLSSLKKPELAVDSIFKNDFEALKNLYNDYEQKTFEKGFKDLIQGLLLFYQKDPELIKELYTNLEDQNPEIEFSPFNWNSFSLEKIDHALKDLPVFLSRLSILKEKLTQEGQDQLESIAKGFFNHTPEEMDELLKNTL